ncbi:MAG: filamentous hemagglutinin N-terminal domain-containing protein, partial [Chitinophagaceae bacterium]|nr:filamentous hemagglutinin N-terminal domain-containing protein [Rubrivivax sp.]
MKSPHFRLRRAVPSHGVAQRVQASCSVMVLTSLGLLGAMASPAIAQSAGGTLPLGTLPVLRGPSPAGVAVNTSVAGATTREMTITQQQQRAIISWDSFNIGRDARVQFFQPSSTASALNRIYGNDPSIIQGQLSANGQVLLVNQNGILFDRGAQVNVRSLVASTLNISDDRFLEGLTNGGLTSPAFAGGYTNTGLTLDARPDGTRPANINVGSFGAADAAAPALRAQAGGSIMILAPRIDVDAGLLSAPDGQVLLAAGKKVYLAENPSSGNAQALQNGLVVEVEAVADGPALSLTNLIRQAGQVSADRGNVTLAALAVNQEGRISSTTAVERSGSIYLQARAKNAEGAERQGSVTLKAGSVTEVMPDVADTATVLEVQRYADFRGVISAQGRTIENHGTLRVPGGVMSLVATDTEAPENARVYLGSGSETSVAGAWSSVPLSKNLATFTVTSNELKNAPDQKTGVLRGAQVTVDLREGSSILALDGYRDIVPRTVTEKAAVGGELSIGSSGSVIQRSGAVIDASGGGYVYEGGQVNTSRLLGADGRVYDIATAPQGQPYTGLLDTFTRRDERWGQTITSDNPLGAVGRFQPGYVEGKAGGVVTLQAAAGLVLDGSLKGGVTIGAQQYGAAPAGASLNLGRPVTAPPTVLGQGVPLGPVVWRQQATDTLGSDFQVGSSLSSAQRQSSVFAAEQFFGAAVVKGTDRVESGFGSVSLYAAGSITVPADVKLGSDPGASLLLSAPFIDIAGDIHLPSGRLALTANLAAGQNPADGAAVAESLIVRSGASLSTAGVWINNSGVGGAPVGTPTPRARLAADGLSSQSTIDGGTISVALEADQMQTRYERGSTLDVGGGAAIDTRGAVVGGKGGVLRLVNGAFGQRTSDWLQADLRGYAINNGAELDLSMSRITVAADGANGLLPADTTRFEAGLFAGQGFGRITLRSNNSLDVDAGTQVRVQQKNLVVDREAAKGAASGTAIADIATMALLPEHERNAATLTLSSVGGGLLGQGRLTLHDDAAIVGDARGSVTLSAVDGLSVLGDIRAPGGSVALTLNGQPLLQADDLVIGSNADISVAGTFVRTPSEQGLVLGNLLNGGSVSITARNTGLQVASGSRIDVSAVNQTVDRVSSGSSPELSTRTLEGHAGTLLMRAQGAVSLEGTLAAQGGSQLAAGGSFALELLRPDGQPVQPDARRVVVTADRNAVPATPDLVDATLNIAALQGAGFDKLRIQSEDRIDLRDSMSLDFERGVRLDAPLIELGEGAQVALRGASVALGQSLGPRLAEIIGGNTAWNLAPGAARPVAPTRAGTGTLSVQAGAVDLFGSFTVNGAALTRIDSDSDIRLVGRNVDFASTTGGSALTRQIGGLSTSGNLELKAAQVVPATRTEFSLTVKDQPTDSLAPGGYILVSNNGKTAGAAYSAGASLTLEADTIVQAGTLKVPLGTLQLQAGSLLELAPGSLSSVAGDGLTVLYGNTDSGVSWLYDTSPSTSAQALDAVTPEGKRITLKGTKVEARPGSVVDLKGGGDVLAIEFIPGNGGDNDITLRDNTFAIIPKARLATMPFDAYTLQLKDPGFGFSRDNGRDGVLYDSITVGAGAEVAAGQYVLLPARYALLPDAYLVRINTSATYRNLDAGQTVDLANGDRVVAGFRSARGTTVQESQSVGVVISPGRATALQSSDYDFNGADFFAASAAANRLAAPRSPWDAGRMQVGAGSTLSLAGSVGTAAASS